MVSFDTAIAEMGDMIRNTLLRAVSTISGRSVAGGDLANLRAIGKLYNLESDIDDMQKEKKI